MLLFIFICFLTYLFYQLLVNFIIPIYRTTRQVKKTFREMNERRNGQPQPPNRPWNEQRPKGQTQKNIKGEYIDFEEVK